MEVRHLEAFVAVVREGSFTRAAERLNLTQPSLSARVQHLEQALEGELFTRQTRPIRLTVIGETFLPFAERVLGILEAGQEAVRIAKTGVAGRLSVGCPVSVSTYLMPQVVNEFSAAYPQAELFIENSHSVNLVQQLQDGVLDLSFTAVFPHLIREAKILLRLHDY
ncbi:MAG: LysR family transcriptional regulator, partial [Anaerolineales bacterium]|nr:LysR family transcriptional regulator [Anaerolineales bacterium]